METKKDSILKRIVNKLIAVAVVAVIVVLILFFTTDTADTKPPYESKIDVSKYVEATEKLEGAIGDYRLIAKSETHELYVKDSSLAIKVKDLATGEVMDSSVDEIQGTVNDEWKGFLQSGVRVELIRGTNDSIVADLINTPRKINMTDLVNGFKAEIDFYELCIKFTMYVTLEGTDVVVAIPDNTIEQYGDPEEGAIHVVQAISVYPCLGATHLGDVEGYMFVPDGSGSLITLEDKEGKFASGYAEMVYGEDDGFRETMSADLLWDEIMMVNDAEEILAPIFGMVHTDREIGYLGIIEEGDKRAEINAIPNGAKIDYNRAFVRFIFNTLYMEPTSNGNTGSIKRYETERTHMDVVLRYRFVSGESADYSGLAVAYRDYLIDNELVKLDLDTSYNTRVDFLGTERENWLTTTKTVTMTTIENIREIYDELKEAGVTDIVSVYKGWQDGGLQDIPITDYEADSDIGGTDELTKLIDELKSTDIKFSLYQESLKINPDESDTTFNVIKRVDKRTFEQTIYMDVYESMKYMTPEKSETVVNGMVGEYTAEGVNAMTLAGITDTLFSYYYSGTHYTRLETAKMFEKTIAAADEKMDLMLEQPFAYLWKYTDAMVDMPSSSSKYIFSSEEVPFYAIALKGVVPMYSEYVNFEANKQQFFLRLVETGMFPSFYITYEDSAQLIYTNSADIYSSKYSVYKQEIIDYANELSAFNAKVDGAVITDHSEPVENVMVVTYSNGVKVYVNYNEGEVLVDGVQIDGMSYKVGDGNE
ncbi:MAG: hypothetical protein IJP13_03070 [Lachnospiraceae bacterium]|nr:hypothetical protein [Lachnospiraceae bacterium]